MKRIRSRKVLPFVLSLVAVPALVLVALSGCGGIVNDPDDSDTSGTGGVAVIETAAQLASVCDDICHHIIDSCGGGPLDRCLADCTKFDPTDSPYSCRKQYSLFLECMKTVDISCADTRIYTQGCDTERDNYIEACTS